MELCHTVEFSRVTEERSKCESQAQPIIKLTAQPLCLEFTGRKREWVHSDDQVAQNRISCFQKISQVYCSSIVSHLDALQSFSQFEVSVSFPFRTEHTLFSIESFFAKE